jgi:glycosyltransferase involved in cell wall biosynthesis
MAREKHLETLRLVTADPGLALTLIGGGSYRDEVQRVLSRNGGDPHFMGYLIGDDLADAYAAADVFVFPGPEETFGQVVLEAMASGLPVVVSDRGGPQTLVREGETGYICPAHNAKAFAERVRKLRDNPELRRQMGTQARSDAESRPWLGVMRQLERYYDEAVRLYRRWRQRGAR